MRRRGAVLAMSVASLVILGVIWLEVADTVHQGDRGKAPALGTGAARDEPVTGDRDEAERPRSPGPAAPRQ